MIKSTVTAALISIAAASRLAGVSQSTLRRWEEAGAIHSYRTSGNHRRYCRDELMRHLGEEPQSSAEEVLLYCRVSSIGQTKTKDQEGSGLTGQINEVKNWIKENLGDKTVIEYSDVASGLNFQRANLTKLLEEAMSGQHYGKTLVVSHKDRLSRFAATFIESILSHFGVQTVYVHAVDKNSDEDIVNDILDFLAHFNARKQGRRNAAKRKQHISEEIRTKIISLWKSGMFGKDIYEKLYVDGDRCVNSSRIPVKLVYRTLRDENVRLRRGRPTKEAEIRAGKRVTNLGKNSSAAI